MTAAVRVWAPRATSSRLLVAGVSVELAPDPARPGWLASAALTHGTDYSIELDGAVYPDPLGRWLPSGVHGSARAFDPSIFRWADGGWEGLPLSTDSVIYELHVGTFTAEGTLDAAIARLDHLTTLGITHVELMPLAAFDGERGWGYDGVAINAVHQPYGGPEAMQRFVQAAHERGLAVLLDIVHNHLGPSGNYWGEFGPFFTDTHSTPWGDAVNLDGEDSDEVRLILLSSVSSWLRDFHLDGVRLDAVHELRDNRAVHFLEELTDTVAALALEVGRPLTVIAESDRNDPRTVRPAVEGGLGLTAQWDDDIHHALHWILTGESDGYYADFADADRAAHALARAFLHDGRWSSFRGRSHGRPVDFEQTPPERFVASLQTHDQVGNRALGDRLTHLVDRDRLAAGALLLLSLPYTPMLFMGEEWGAATRWQYFTAFDDELGAAVTEGRRSEFGSHGWSDGDVPDPQDPQTHAASTLDWRELESADATRLVDWYAQLIDWHRHELPNLPLPRCYWDTAADGRPRWWAVARGSQLAIVSLADTDVSVRLDVPTADLSVRAAWSGAHTIVEVDTIASLVSVGAGECLILQQSLAPDWDVVAA